MSEQRRLFFALLPDVDLLAAMVGILDGLDGKLGRRVRPENLHLTLAFIGSADAQLAECLQDRAATIELPEFSFTLNRLGHFPRSGVLWLGSAERSRPLLDLVHELTEALIPCGFRPERRPFAPHVTLMRKLRRRPRLPEVPTLEWPVRAFVLMESLATDAGVRYEVVRSYPLSSRD